MELGESMKGRKVHKCWVDQCPHQHTVLAEVAHTRPLMECFRASKEGSKANYKRWSVSIIAMLAQVNTASHKRLSLSPSDLMTPLRFGARWQAIHLQHSFSHSSISSLKFSSLPASSSFPYLQRLRRHTEYVTQRATRYLLYTKILE